MSADNFSDQDNSFNEVTIDSNLLDDCGLENLDYFHASLPQPQLVDLTFEETVRSIYFENTTYSQVECKLKETLDQVKSPEHLDQLIRGNIQQYSQIVKNELLEKINSIRRESIQDTSTIQQEVVEKIFESQCLMEDISKEVDKVIQLYFEQPELQMQSTKILKDFNCQDYHQKQFQEIVYNESQVIKDFLDQIIYQNSEYTDDQRSLPTQISQAYSILHKQKGQPQRQLPKPSHSIKVETKLYIDDNQIYGRQWQSRFPFANPTEPLEKSEKKKPQQKHHNPDYHIIRASLAPFYNQYFAQATVNFEDNALNDTAKSQSSNKKRRNKKKKNYNNNEPTPPQKPTEPAKQRPDVSRQKIEDTDESKAKHSDEIKEFEKRLEQAHEGLKDGEKLKVNVPQDWVRKMHQLRQKKTQQNQAGAQRR